MVVIIGVGIVVITDTVPQAKPVVVLKRALAIQPTGKAIVPQAVPVVILKPAGEAQPGFKFPAGALVTLLILVTQTVLDLTPNIPSVVNWLDFCQRMTAPFVFGPNLPSACIFKLVCRHFTCSPLEPSFNVVVILQSAEAMFVKVKSIIEKVMIVKDNLKIAWDTLFIEYILS